MVGMPVLSAHSGVKRTRLVLFPWEMSASPPSVARAHQRGAQASSPPAPFLVSGGLALSGGPRAVTPYFKVTVFKTPARLLPFSPSCGPTPLLPPLDLALRGHGFKTKMWVSWLRSDCSQGRGGNSPQRCPSGNGSPSSSHSSQLLCTPQPPGPGPGLGPCGPKPRRTAPGGTEEAAGWRRGHHLFQIPYCGTSK